VRRLTNSSPRAAADGLSACVARRPCSGVPDLPGRLRWRATQAVGARSRRHLFKTGRSTGRDSSCASGPCFAVFPRGRVATRLSSIGMGSFCALIYESFGCDHSRTTPNALCQGRFGVRWVSWAGAKPGDIEISPGFGRFSDGFAWPGEPDGVDAVGPESAFRCLRAGAHLPVGRGWSSLR
jgi:hypothetical protein